MNEEAGTYADASPLIGLALIDQLHLLRILPQPIYVTGVVWGEATADPTKPGATRIIRAESLGLLRRVNAGDLDAYPGLDPGESTVLSAASSTGAIVLIDDIDAHRRLAGDRRLRVALPTVFTTTSFLAVARRRGAIPAVRPLLDALLAAGFGVTVEDYAAALHAAGESDN